MTIFNKIGNFFNKNGNTVGKIMTATGATAMGVAGMGMTWRAMNSNSSIFGGCGCMGMGGMSPFGMGGFGMSGMSPFSMGGMGPFGMPGFGMPGFGMGGYNMGGCSVFGGMNPMFGMQQAFASGQQFVSSGNYQNNPWGLLNGSYNFNTNTTSTTTEIDLDDQKRLDKKEYDDVKLEENEGDKAKGDKFDNKLEELSKPEGEGREQIDIGKDKDAISELGKNYLKSMDTDGDGLITETEFVKHETKGRLSKLDNAEDLAKVAFRKIDQNRSEKIDWKELSATIAALDTNGDGKITNSEFKTKSEQMTKHKDLKFDHAVKDKYENFFEDK